MIKRTKKRFMGDRPPKRHGQLHPWKKAGPARRSEFFSFLPLAMDRERKSETACRLGPPSLSKKSANRV
jgi:hypothetical protein